MDLAHLTPSLKTCRALRDSGFPQDTAFAWTRKLPSAYSRCVAPRATSADGEAQDADAAPTLSEVLAQLPRELDFEVPHPLYESVPRTHTLEVRLNGTAAFGYRLVGCHQPRYGVQHDNPVEAAARLYLTLRAAGLLPAPGAFRPHAAAPAVVAEAA